jgi:hypothetical protein
MLSPKTPASTPFTSNRPSTSGGPPLPNPIDGPSSGSHTYPGRGTAFDKSVAPANAAFGEHSKWSSGEQGAGSWERIEEGEEEQIAAAALTGDMLVPGDVRCVSDSRCCGVVLPVTLCRYGASYSTLRKG